MDWFRMYNEFASDPKVQSMSEAMQRRLVMLLCLRCSNELETLQDEEIATALRIDEAALAETKALFVRKNFIDDAWNVVSWNERQYVSDSSTARVAAHRAKKKQEAKQVGNVSVTPPDTDTDTDTDTDKNKRQAHSTSASPPADFFVDIDPQVVADFKAMRAKHRAPITKTVVTALQREATKAGMSMEAVLTLCCLRNWRGFQAAWVTPEAQAAQAGQSPTDKARNWSSRLQQKGKSDGLIDINARPR